MSTDTAPPPSLPAPPSRRSRGGLLLLLCALSACAILGLQLRQSLERERQLAARASSLENDVDHLEASARLLEFDMDSLSRRNDTCTANLKRAESEVATLEESLRLSTRRMAELESSLSKSRSDQAASQQALRRLEREVAVKEADLELTSTKLKAEEQRSQQLNRQLRQCATELEGMRVEATELEITVSQLKYKASDLEGAVNVIARTIRDGMIGLPNIPPPGPFSGPGFLSIDCETLLIQYNDLVDRFNASLRRSQHLAKVIDEVAAALR